MADLNCPWALQQRWWYLYTVVCMQYSLVGQTLVVMDDVLGPGEERPSDASCSPASHCWKAGSPGTCAEYCRLLLGPIASYQTPYCTREKYRKVPTSIDNVFMLYISVEEKEMIFGRNVVRDT